MTDVPKYRLDLAYLGGTFHGWQSQKSGRGIQDTVERALAVILRHDVRLTSASRTDTGVHAEYQVCTFKSASPFDAFRWLQGLNGLMVDTVRARAVAPVPDTFHPIRSALGKAYRYRIWNCPVDSPFFANQCWRIYGDLNVGAMQREAEFMLGEHDFTSFCATDSTASTKVRRVLEIEISRHGHLLDIWVVGEGFLKQMIRNMVGTLVAVGGGKIPSASTPAILAPKDRRAAPKTAPAQGLCLVKIFYEDVLTVPALKAEAASGFTIAT